MLQEKKELKNHLGKADVEGSVKNAREFNQINLTLGNKTAVFVMLGGFLSKDGLR